MPRKKIIQKGKFLRYIPSGSLNTFELLANNFPFIQDKTIALYKYIDLFSSLVERCENVEKEYVPISYAIQKKILGIDDVQLKRMLSDLLSAGLFKIDKSTFKIRENSYSYKPVYDELDQVAINKESLLPSVAKKLTNVSNLFLDDECRNYIPIIAKLQWDNSIVDYIMCNYDYCIEGYFNNDIDDDDNNNEIYITQQNCTLDKNDRNNNINLQQNCTLNVNSFDSTKSSRNNRIVPYAIRNRKVQKSIRDLENILNDGFKVKGKSRRFPNGRVYTSITNLKSEFRTFLRLNGKALLGFDISNSQPLIAAVLFKLYSEKIYGQIQPDVVQYQKDCEAGRFYEYFMEKNGIDTSDEKARTEFKKKFFAKVFFSMEVEADNELKNWFKEKYPTCYEAIFNVKGGFYDKEQSKKFPELMTEIETTIMWKTDLKLIAMGYDVVNIFDSLYSDSIEAIAKAKELVFEKFAEFGITPKLKDISYSTNPPEPQKQSMMKKETSTEQVLTSKVQPLTRTQFQKLNYEKFNGNMAQINLEYEKYICEFQKEEVNEENKI